MPTENRSAPTVAAAPIAIVPDQRPRLILLGASNLTLGFPLILRSLQLSIEGPFEVFTAHGHGRSFCQWSYVLHRGLPPIPDCGVWPVLQTQPHSSATWGLVTDVGNDLIYGNSVDRVQSQVQLVFQRLQQLGADITFVRLPLERILLLTERRYRVTKQLLFPGPTVPWREMSRRVVELDQRVSDMAREFQATILTPRREWYGVDPIHIRRGSRLSAWREILATAPRLPQLTMQRPPVEEAFRIWQLPPAERTFWKRSHLTSQPVIQKPTGLTLWQY